jgi:transposase
MTYNRGFKDRMVQRMSVPDPVSSTALSVEVGVPQQTLSRWMREARMFSSMSNTNKGKDQKSPRQWSAQEKLAVVIEAAQVSEEDLGEFLRGKGLHTAQLVEWRQAAEAALEGTKKQGRRKASSEKKVIKGLEKDLRRMEKALAEASALLVLKKKAQAIWGDEGDVTRQ